MVGGSAKIMRNDSRFLLGRSKLEVSYMYEVDGRYYQSNRYDVMGSFAEGSYEEVVELRGSPANRRVFYDPDVPERAVRKRGIPVKKLINTSFVANILGWYLLLGAGGKRLVYILLRRPN